MACSRLLCAITLFAAVAAACGDDKPLGFGLPVDDAGDPLLLGRDAARPDATSVAPDAGSPDALTPNDGGPGCGPTELCGNGLDDDCNGRVDEGCPCPIGSTQPCYSGNPTEAGKGVCTFGTQTCLSTSDLGAWGTCTGEGRPEPTVCGAMKDARCTGIIDEGCGCPVGQTRGCYGGPAGTQGVGLCREGSQSCVATATSAAWTPCAGEVLPAATNACDGQDNLCNGLPYSGCACTPGESRGCYDGPAGTQGVGLCAGGTQSCQVVNGVPAWGECVGQILPSPNTCDGVDRLCTGNPNSGGCGCVLGTSRACYDGAPGTAGVGVCVGGVQTCEPVPGAMGSGWGVCGGQVIPSANTCDGIDRQCDGNPLANCTCVVGQTRACYSAAAGTRNVGVCREGTQTCDRVGPGSDWVGACVGEVGPSPAEVCGNGLDDDCNGSVDEGCDPSIQCPPDVIIPAGNAVALTANASSPNGPIVGYSWAIVGAPTGGVGTPNQWTPNPPTSQTESFLPYIVGVYTLQVTATDATNRQTSCQMRVTAEGHGLRVQLSWNGTGDIDLHVHAPNTVTPWFRAPDDCFYSNLTPIWDPASPVSLGANPSLDFDNTTANGPENTNIDTPQLNVPYTVAVHNYARGAGRIATVELFCGGVTSPTQVFTSRALNGTSSGNSSSNDFWRVAQIVFTSPTSCTITPLNTYGPSSTYNSVY